MITCLECGKTAMRLQWTHFKYQCTGRFNNGKEYMKEYIGAKVVDESLSKRTAVTKDNLIAKYGENEGILRWEKYRKKQSESNSLAYKKEKYGWTEQDFESYNKSRATTLTNMIQKYGEEDGLVKWEEYCTRQQYTTTMSYFIEKYGEEDGLVKWDAFNTGRTKSTNIDYIMEKYQVTREDAMQILSSRLSGNCVSAGEKQFIEQVETLLDDITHTYKNKQFCIWNNYIHLPMFYDITSTTRQKIIEYNGDYWHTNPTMYNESFVVKQSGKTASEIREYDRLKILSATERGFSVYVVWESDYQADPESVIATIKDWWYNDIQR